MRHWRVATGLLALVMAGQAHVTGPWSRTGTYTVRRGENLSVVAKRTGVPVAALAAANAIPDRDYVRRGQVLRIPPEQPPAPRSRPAAVTPRRALAPLPSRVVVVDGTRRYRVRRGDTLATIASRHGVSVRELMRVNGIAKAGSLGANRSLRVPGPSWLCPVQGGRVDFADGWGHFRAGGRRHLGTDLFAFRGTRVVASVGGALFHRPGARAGLAYLLRGDDGNTYYGAHLQTLVARPGRIERGALIGTVGSSGNAEGTTPHLHFEIHPNGGGPVNPVYTLRRWC
ncbi:MAG: M23 family metallopeptidase [Actinomycetota bacterium]|nr:M23 family metallopeptidase [Actinomycetota bacterium]MDQ3681266.1 M23 family metallopeptidase [Actinomycetota bacterium]